MYPLTVRDVSLRFSGLKISPMGYEEWDEVTITRQVVIGGKNKYLINGRTVQQSQVTNLFHSVQLNVNNPHFLIMQASPTYAYVCTLYLCTDHRMAWRGCAAADVGWLGMYCCCCLAASNHGSMYVLVQQRIVQLNPVEAAVRLNPGVCTAVSQGVY